MYVCALLFLLYIAYFCVLPTRTPPGNPYLHERVGRGAYGKAAVVLVSGLDLSTGETGTVIGEEGGSPRGNTRS